MVDYQTLSIVLTGIGMIIAFTYYALQIRNQNKTRQAQLYMGIINTFNSLEFRTQWHISESTKWTDYDNYKEKYTPEKNQEVLTANVTMFTFFDSIGALVKKNLLNLELVDGSLALSIVVTWRMYEEIIMGDREYFQAPSMWEDFEYIYYELNKREKYASARSPHKI